MRTLWHEVQCANQLYTRYCASSSKRSANACADWPCVGVFLCRLPYAFAFIAYDGSRPGVLRVIEHVFIDSLGNKQYQQHAPVDGHHPINGVIYALLHTFELNAMQFQWLIYVRKSGRIALGFGVEWHARHMPICITVALDLTGV